MNTNTIQTPGELAHKYRFIKLLGEGANGKTYLAVHTNSGVKVAVKALKFTQQQDFKSLELFKREASILSSIRMEGIPQFYESVFPDDNQNTCYIIQEYVQYPSLQAILDNIRKFSEKDTLDIIGQLALLLFGLQTVYTPPIIHRDIKPSNILCQRDKLNLHVYLIDFGAVANPQRRTGGSTVAGTFGYMAPEQLLGDICIQSDYYALGATALHMLTGIPPYKLESDGFHLHFQSVLKKEAPDTSKAMISLLEVLLAPEIDKRPPNARKLIQMIHMAQKGQIVSIKTLEDEMPVVPQYRGGLLKRFLSSKLSAHFQPSNSIKDWETTSGYIQCQRAFMDENGTAKTSYEYTFEVDQISYAGNYFPTKESDLQFTVFPSECNIIYNPDNPRMNMLSKQQSDPPNNATQASSPRPHAPSRNGMLRWSDWE